MMEELSTMVCILGAPGSGKGTQGALLAEHLAGHHLSVGDLVRAKLAAGARVPRERKSRLVDTQFTVDLILGAAGGLRGPIVLDGFPRDASQVEALMQLPWKCVAVIWLEVDLDTALARMISRGREGENVAQIGMRHLNHDLGAGALRDALKTSGLRVHEIDARAAVAAVQRSCQALTHSACG